MNEVSNSARRHGLNFREETAIMKNRQGRNSIGEEITSARKRWRRDVPTYEGLLVTTLLERISPGGGAVCPTTDLWSIGRHSTPTPRINRPPFVPD